MKNDRELKEKGTDAPVTTVYEQVRGRLRGKLINTDRNAELLEKVPHREILDLSLVYVIDMTSYLNGCHGNIQINDRLMKEWGVDEDRLYTDMMANMEASDDTELSTIESVLGEMDTFLLPMEGQPQLYIATNKSRYLGAVKLLDKKFLKEAAAKFGSDFMILPSSIHELLFLPLHEDMAPALHLAQVVKEVNDYVVSEEEILGYKIYRYSDADGTVTIAA